MSERSHRLVIFVGPHKSASSTVQEFFVQYATGRPKYRKLKALIGWRWPVLPHSRIPFRKQWARLVYQQSDLRVELKQAFQKTVANFPNIVIGSEEFDRFGETPWSHRNGIYAVQQLIEWAELPPNSTVDIVVNYRTPRHTQWISIWKQLMSLDENLHNQNSNNNNNNRTSTSISYKDWICQTSQSNGKHYDDKVWEYLDCVANPLGLTRALLQALSPSTKVTLIDMGGVAQRNLDIAHVSACQVLGLPCTDGWVRGINRTLRVNPKHRPLEGVTSYQLQQLEWLLQQRDCTYRTILQEYVQQKRLVILYPEMLDWKQDHCNNNNKIMEFQNTTFLLYAMQSQFGCQPSHFVSIDFTNLMRMTNKEISNYQTVIIIPSQDWLFIQVLFQWIMIGLLFTGLLQIRKRQKWRLRTGSSV